MARRRRTDLPTAALVMELSESEGRGRREISAMTGVPASTVETILKGANGWAEITEGEIFKRHRQEQNKALEQVNRTMAGEALKKAWGKMDGASFYQLVYGAAIMTDKARLLAGESTENISIVSKHSIEGLDKLCELLSQSLMGRGKAGNGGQGAADPR